MRILMVGSYPRTLERIDGGVAAAVTYLSQALTRQESVELIGVRTGGRGGSDQAESDFGFPVYDFDGGSLGLASLYRSQARQLKEIIRRTQPDIVHGQGADMAGYLAAGCGRPSVITVHGIIGEDSKFQTAIKTRIRSALIGRLIERSTIRRARDVISISPYVAQYYGRQLRGRMHDIPNAIAEQYFEVRRAPEAGRILFAGRLIPRKGVVDLIRAVALAGTSVRRVVLAGSLSDIEYVAQLRVEVDRLGLTGVVDFRGLLDESEMLQEFAKAELLALPSYQETAPMVIQQAMASGVPIVASAICGVPFQVEHGRAGLLHEAGDVASLAESLRRLTTEPGLSDRFGAAAKISAEARYRAGNVATATLAAYRTVLMNR